MREVLRPIEGVVLEGFQDPSLSLACSVEELYSSVTEIHHEITQETHKEIWTFSQNCALNKYICSIKLPCLR